MVNALKALGRRGGAGLVSLVMAGVMSGVITAGASGGGKGDRGKGSAAGTEGGVTAKEVAPNPGNVPQPADAPAPASEPVKPRNAASVADKRETAEGISWKTPAGWSQAGARPMRVATLTDGQA